MRVDFPIVKLHAEKHLPYPMCGKRVSVLNHVYASIVQSDSPVTAVTVLVQVRHHVLTVS